MILNTTPRFQLLGDSNFYRRCARAGITATYMSYLYVCTTIDDQAPCEPAPLHHNTPQLFIKKRPQEVDYTKVKTKNKSLFLEVYSSRNICIETPSHRQRRDVWPIRPWDGFAVFKFRLSPHSSLNILRFVVGSEKH